MWIERKVEGDRPARMRLDREATSLRKLRLKATKHALWLVIALWTGVSFVGYFTPIDVLLGKIMSLALGPWESFWILFYGFATWGNAGFMREQVCIYMCPYARFQSAMFDRDTMVITYDQARGEPRGSRSKKADPKAIGLGDCVNCGLCVEVCPTGIDIREGLQYQCIGCAACVDACDKVMDRVGYPKGLIRYDTENGLANRWNREQLMRRVRRPRVLVYSAILVALTVALFTHLALRTPLKVDVIRDRGSLGREVDGGQIENVYRLMLINGAETARTLRISVAGIESISVASEAQVMVAAAEAHAVAVRVRIAPDHRARSGMNAIEFTVTATDDSSVSVREKSTFYVPR